MIKNINGLYYVFNKEGTEKLSKAYETKQQAEERLKEIESFKSEDKLLEDAYKDEEFEDAEYQGKEVTLNKPFRNTEGNSKFSVYVRNEKGNVIKVNFGDPNMEIKRDDPERRKAFRERHNCEEKKDKTTAGYWSCKFWSSESVSSLVDSIMTIDKGFNEFEKFIDKQTGFLHINGIVARTGIQDYLGLELGDKENPTKTFGVYRPKEEVLSKESLDSYTNSIVTDNHPQEFVTTDNIKELGKGSTSSIETFEKDGIDYIKAKMTITDKNLINKVLSGKVEISAGYTQNLIKEKGEFQGKQYDYKQTNIRINHVAIVDRGRCGDKCKITTDNYNIIDSEINLKGEIPMVKLKIGDAEVEVCDTVYSHINSLNDSIKAKDAEMEKLKGENEKLKEDMEEEKAKTADASTIDDLVSEKVALIDTAKTLKVEVKSTDSIMDMKKAIISSSSKISLDGKSDEFIDGVYETVIASTVGKQKAIKDSQSKAFDGFEGKAQTTQKFQDMAKETL